jgi:hypothetical protein
LNSLPEIDKIISKTNYVTFPHSTAFVAKMSRSKPVAAIRANYTVPFAIKLQARLLPVATVEQRGLRKSQKTLTATFEASSSQANQA